MKSRVKIGWVILLILALLLLVGPALLGPEPTDLAFVPPVGAGAGAHLESRAELACGYPKPIIPEPGPTPVSGELDGTTIPLLYVELTTEGGSALQAELDKEVRKLDEQLQKNPEPKDRDRLLRQKILLLGGSTEVPV